MSKQWVDTFQGRFVDHRGRQVILRGVNLGGDSKVPYPDGGTERYTDFSDHRTVSFVGRPFPRDEADAHLGRLVRWGFNTVRLVVTWEAIEHTGPAQFDTDYLAYIAEVCTCAQAHRLFVIIDFHQDVWSRMSGGSGAPGWLFDALGLDFTQFDAAGAAHIMQARYDYTSSERVQETRYPPMSWPINYHMPVNGILWTAFFDGARLTPDWRIDGLNVQQFLWRHFFGAIRALAERIGHLPNVIGFDSLNEPGTGWLGQPVSTAKGQDPSPLRPLPIWTPLDGLKVARGMTTTLRCPVANAGRTQIIGEHQITVNTQRIPIWKPGMTDPFEQAGAWTVRDGQALVLDEDFFRVRDGRPLDIENDCMAAFFEAVAKAFRDLRQEWLLFAEINPYATSRGRAFPRRMPSRSVNASHWYDIRLLWSKQFPEVTNETERADTMQRYSNQLGHLRSLGERINAETGGAPTLIGEFGTPYDLNHGISFERWAAGERGEDLWSAQTAALELMYDAMDALQLSSTQWNYTATNSNDLRIGDRWNQEDLSIFSPEQLTEDEDPYSGARAARGFCRAYAQAIQGRLRMVRYETRQQRLTLAYDADARIDAPTEVFLPPHFRAPDVQVLEGDVEVQLDLAAQRLSLRAHRSGLVRVQVQDSHEIAESSLPRRQTTANIKLVSSDRPKTRAAPR